MGATRGTMSALVLAVFTVSAGYGAVLPHLPDLVAGLLGPAARQALISRHTGLLTAAYTLALFIFAPLWGRASDRFGRRAALFAALAGFGIATLLLAPAKSLVALYAERFFSAAFAAAITPVAGAALAERAATEHARARSLALLSMGGIAGFFLGPMLGVATQRASDVVLGAAKPAAALAMPLAAVALLAFATAFAVAIALRRDSAARAPAQGETPVRPTPAHVLRRLLALSFTVSAAIGVFEVGLALHGRQQMGLSELEIALMFAECSLVMLVIQGIAFSRLVRPEASPALIVPALSILATGLLFVSRIPNYALTLAVVSAVAASAGVLSPLLTYWISRTSGPAQGWQLGRQTAAASLGVTAGSAAAGLLFNVPALTGVPFLLAAALAGAAVVLSLPLRRALVPVSA